MSEDAIQAHVEAMREAHVGFLRQLVRIPKPRMREHQAVRFAADALRKAGCDVELFEGKGLGEPTPDGPPLNVLARRPGTGGGGGRSLLLEAHMDVVPPGRLERWTHGPWSGDLVDGRVYARGAHDDLAGAALVCLVGDTLEKLQLRTSGDLYLLLTTEEEFSSGGMRALVERHPQLRPDAHLLVDGNGEPQECIAGHPGSVSFRIEIPGPFGTAQAPRLLHEGNPIEFAGRLTTALRRLESTLAARPRPAADGLEWPRPSVAIVGIRSTGWISNVPEWCELEVWGNVIPPMTIDEYRAAVESCVQLEARASSWFAAHPPTIAWGPINVPALMPKTDSAFYSALAKAHHASFGTALVPRLIGGWGDMRLLGSPQALFYGPGGGGHCHGYDEYYRVADLAPMLRALLYLVTDWCGVQS